MPALAFARGTKFFHTVEKVFPLCGKIAKHFSIAWKTFPRTLNPAP